MDLKISTGDWHQELRERRSNICTIVTEHDCDIGLIYASRELPEPFRYLTNFVPTLGDMWGILTGSNRMKSILNFHWELKDAARVSGLEDWHGYFDPIPFLIENLVEISPQRIAVLGLDRIPWSAYQSIVERIQKVEFIDIGNEFNLLRRHKSPLEIDLLRESCRITDLALDLIRDELVLGMTEFEIRARILYSFNLNAADSAFSPLVMGGNDEQTAVIGRAPRDRPLETGDSLMIDIGAQYQGYQADVARTFVLGKPNRLQQDVWDTVQRAHEKVVSMAKPGLPCKELHDAALKIFSEAGHRFLHRIGHGIGLATSFEWPSLDTEPAVLEPGMTLAIEPAIYVVGAGAMKLEDDILITESGCEILSNCSRDFVVNV